MAKSKPILEVDLGDNGGKLSFRTLEEIETWVQEETSIWGWLAATAQQDGNVATILNRQISPFQPIQQAVAQARVHIETEQFPSHLEAVKQQMLAHYGSAPAVSLLASTPRAMFVFELKETDPILAAYVLGYFISVPVVQNVHRSLEGALEALMFEKGYRKSLAAEKRALNKLREKWQTELTDYKTKLDELNTDYETKKREIGKLHVKQGEDFDQALLDGKEELEKVTATYEQKMALQAPVQYWKEKKTTHHDLARNFAWASGGWLSVSGGILIATIYGVLHNLEAGKNPALWQSLSLAASAFVVVWIARILVKITLSHLHLKEDASERVTMAETYLSLLRHEGGPEKGDLELILTTLFRPNSDGLVKDDGMPPTVMEWMTRNRG